MSERHANVQPSRMPLMIDGSAAGKMTRIYNVMPLAPIVRAARK
jgi:hypothetical protein